MSDLREKLLVSEIFTSIQGEGTQCGHPMRFIRLSGCNLKCIYCDTKKILNLGREFTIEELLDEVKSFPHFPVYITGGEPLIQKSTTALIDSLLESGREVFLDTNGTIDLANVNRSVKKIIDIKTPGSMSGSEFLASNLRHVAPFDEIKIVVTSLDDFQWAIETIDKLGIPELTPNVIFQPAWGIVDPRDLAQWIISSTKPIRLGMQIHKYIWGPDTLGV